MIPASGLAGGDAGDSPGAPASQTGRWIVAKVNTDALPELGERYRIMSIPTMAVFKGGREVARTSGARPADQIEAFVRQASA